MVFNGDFFGGRGQIAVRCLHYLQIGSDVAVICFRETAIKLLQK